mgnify:CR=1 FL=1
MNSGRLKVEVHWRLEGKAQLPTGHLYSTVARFLRHSENWPGEAWSVVIDFGLPPSMQGKVSEGVLRFLSPKGPVEWLNDEQDIELYEGRSLVGLARRIT